MSSVDKERVIELISVINKNLVFIENEKITSVDRFKTSTKDYYAVSMAIFTTLNKLIELGEQLIESLDKNIYPKKYNEIPKILFEEKIISKELFKKLNDLIKYRNDIAHEYEQIYENEIFWCVQNISSIKDFIKIIKNKLLK